LSKGFIGLAFQTSNFAALLNFLETQGSVSVLSSPRIATLNNQKAVLKVGDDELFVTNITVLDDGRPPQAPVSPDRQRHPQPIDVLGHLARRDAADRRGRQHHPPRPSGGHHHHRKQQGDRPGRRYRHHAAAGREPHQRNRFSIVRVQDGNIVAIGGLMRQEQSSDRSQLPGATGFFGQRAGPALIRAAQARAGDPDQADHHRQRRAWTQDIKDVQERVRAYPSARPAQ
jgi:MSHA biogenesis protein MshL